MATTQLKTAAEYEALADQTEESRVAALAKVAELEAANVPADHPGLVKAKIEAAASANSVEILLTLAEIVRSRAA